jgi:hypothetical protein
MTISELRLFIAGMEIAEAPTPEQWATIKGKLAETHEPVQYHDGTGREGWSDFYTSEKRGPIPDLYG